MARDKKVYFTGAFPGHPHRGYLESVAQALKAERYNQQYWARPITREDEGMDEIFRQDKAALLGADLAVIFLGSIRADVEQLFAAQHDVPHLLIYPPDFADQDPYLFHATTGGQARRWGWQVGTLGLDEVMETIRVVFTQ